MPAPTAIQGTCKSDLIAAPWVFLCPPWSPKIIITTGTPDFFSDQRAQYAKSAMALTTDKAAIFCSGESQPYSCPVASRSSICAKTREYTGSSLLIAAQALSTIFFLLRKRPNSSTDLLGKTAATFSFCTKAAVFLFLI